MLFVAGDGVGILVGAVIEAIVALSWLAGVAVEYVLGFAFGWAIFQALFMEAMAGSYRKSLASTFTSELESMNILMAAMIFVRTLLVENIDGADHPPPRDRHHCGDDAHGHGAPLVRADRCNRSAEHRCSRQPCWCRGWSSAEHQRIDAPAQAESASTTHGF